MFLFVLVKTNILRSWYIVLKKTRDTVLNYQCYKTWQNVMKQALVNVLA